MAKAVKKTKTVDFDKLERPTSATTPVANTKGTKQMADASIVELDMNLEDYDDFEPLPAGEYPATVTLAEKRTSDKGNDYYYLTFQIHPDDYPADYSLDNAPEGTNLTWARTQVPSPNNRRSITNVKNLMRALGLKLNSSIINPGDWEGKRAKLVINKGNFNGMPNNSIVSVEAID